MLWLVPPLVSAMDSTHIYQQAVDIFTEIISLHQLPLEWLQDTSFSNTEVKHFTKTLRQG